MTERLARSGIPTMETLLATQPKHVRALWGNVNGERLWYALHGYQVNPPPSSRGIYGHGRVLPPDQRSLAQARTVSRLLLVKPHGECAAMAGTPVGLACLWRYTATNGRMILACQRCMTIKPF